MLRFGSVCSGIEAASVAWEPLGFCASWLSEIEKFPSAVLAHHWPDVENMGDMTALPEMVKSKQIEAPDLLVGGTPCQAFSVAGLRKGLTDERGQLTIKFVELANAIDNVRLNARKPESIIVWENVPGVLSSKDNAFGCFLAGLCGETDELQPTGKRWANAGCVYGPQRAVAWRILDAQYFGVAQRRRRVFVVASARAGFDPAAVLFEFEGVRRDSAPSREAGETIAADFTGSARAPSHWDGNGPHPTLNQSHNTGGIGASNQELFSQRGAGLVPVQKIISMAHGQGGAEIRTDGGAPCLTCNHEAPIACYPIHDKTTRHAGQSGKGSGNGLGVGNLTDPCPTLTVGDKHAVASFQQNASGELRESDIGYTLNTNSNPSGRNTGMIREQMQVRRLTPTECERLQGFPDGHTAIEWRGKPATECPDGPRYKACGNSMAVPVMRWIGERIQKELSGER